MIPTVSEKLVKSLVKLYRVELNDMASVKEMLNQAEVWLKALEKSGLPGKYTARGYQQGTLPRLLWPLLVYKVPLTTVEALEKKFNNFLRRWLSFSKKLLLDLPVQYGEQAATSNHISHGRVQDSLSPVGHDVAGQRGSGGVAGRYTQIDTVKTGQKWDVSSALRDVEERLRHADIVGTVNRGKMGLSCITRASWKEAKAMRGKAWCRRRSGQ